MGIQFILEFVLVLAFVIFIHELGHFAAARMFGIEVDEFGFGIPPRAATLFTTKRGMAVTLNWLPLGGFVRIRGEGDPSVEGGLGAAPAWQRVIVYLAGSAMNILAAVILFGSMFVFYGDPVVRENQLQIVSVDAGSPAEAAQVQACDILVSIDQQPVTTLESLTPVLLANIGQPVSLSYQRNGLLETTTIIPQQPVPEEGKGSMGVRISNPLDFEPVGLWEAAQRSVVLTKDTSLQILSIPMQLFNRDQEQPQDESGRVVGIVGMTQVYSAVRTGDLLTCTPPVLNVINFILSLTISLGILNLLPIPALDGGRILFTLPELLFRYRIPPRYENLVNYISFMLLIGLLLYFNFRDVVDPIVLP